LTAAQAATERKFALACESIPELDYMLTIVDFICLAAGELKHKNYMGIHK